jgi:hypothetical protein
MIKVGLERILTQGRIWLEEGYLKIKEVGASISGLSPDDNHLHIYVKDKSGTATPYWKDDADVEHEFAGTSIVPPIDADYLVKTANATLTAERVVTDTASITVDWATAGQAKFQREALTGDVTAAQNSNATTIANDAVTTAKIINDAVTNAKLADMAAWTVKARNNAASGDPQDVALADLTEEASPASGDYLFAFDSTGALRKINWSNVSSVAASGHLHGLTRLVADGSSTTFNLLDIAEYLDGATDDGIRTDALDYTLSADGSQVTFSYTPVSGNVLEINYAIMGA